MSVYLGRVDQRRIVDLVPFSKLVKPKLVTYDLVENAALVEFLTGRSEIS